MNSLKPFTGFQGDVIGLLHVPLRRTYLIN